MKDPIISFETAKLAKEKGFDIGVSNEYQQALTEALDPETNSPTGAFGWAKGEINLESSYIRNNGDGDYSSENWYCCAAPTQSLLQRWLRERFLIDIVIDRASGIKEIISNKPNYLYKVKPWSMLIITFERDGFDSYEEALEEALQASLESIT